MFDLSQKMNRNVVGMVPRAATQHQTAPSTANRKQQKRSPKNRRGLGSVEVLVAFTLLSTVLAISTPLIVKHGRLLTSHRHYRLGLDELTNQLERLTALPETDLRQALEQLKPSEFTAKRIPGVELRGELSPVDLGQRLTLQLWWDEPGRREHPLKLSGWVFPGSHSTTDQATEVPSS